MPLHTAATKRCYDIAYGSKLAEHSAFVKCLSDYIITFFIEHFSFFDIFTVDVYMTVKLDLLL